MNEEGVLDSLIKMDSDGDGIPSGGNISNQSSGCAGIVAKAFAIAVLAVSFIVASSLF